MTDEPGRYVTRAEHESGARTACGVHHLKALCTLPRGHEGGHDYHVVAAAWMRMVMGIDTFKKLPLPEAKLMFHRNAAEGNTYITVSWSEKSIRHGEGISVTKGFKFIVDNEIMDRWENRGQDKK